MYIKDKKNLNIFLIRTSEETHYQWYENGQLYSEINYLNGKPWRNQNLEKDGKLRSTLS